MLGDAVLEGGRVGSMCALRCATIKCGATGFALPFGGLYGNTRESPLRAPRTPGRDNLSKSKKLRLCQALKTCPLRSTCDIDVIKKMWCQVHGNNPLAGFLGSLFLHLFEGPRYSLHMFAGVMVNNFVSTVV